MWKTVVEEADACIERQDNLTTASDPRVSSGGLVRVEVYKAEDVSVVCWSRPSDGNSESIPLVEWVSSSFTV